MKTFTERLLERLFAAQFAEETDNYDHQRFGERPRISVANAAKRELKRAIKACGFLRPSWIHAVDKSALAQWAPLFTELDWLNSLLADKDSRELLVQLVAYRLMGPRAVRLPLSAPDYWQQRDELERLAEPGESIPIDFKNWRLSQYDLESIGFPLRLFARTPGIMALFVLQQYVCERGGIRARPGDGVIDAGGCYGDTALMFGHLVGTTGRVYTFEFVPSNLAVLQRNLALNAEISQQIELVKHPLWSRSGLPVFIQGNGTASRVWFSSPSPEIEPTTTTLTIDDFVSANGLDRVDFIKMDIEGAEPEALRGAEQTIRTFKPSLALCVYHDANDFVRLAKFVDELGIGYNFYLGHFTIHAEETILFASVVDPPRNV